MRNVLILIPAIILLFIASATWASEQHECEIKEDKIIKALEEIPPKIKKLKKQLKGPVNDTDRELSKWSQEQLKKYLPFEKLIQDEVAKQAKDPSNFDKQDSPYLDLAQNILASVFLAGPRGNWKLDQKSNNRTFLTFHEDDADEDLKWQSSGQRAHRLRQFFIRLPHFPLQKQEKAFDAFWEQAKKKHDVFHYKNIYYNHAVSKALIKWAKEGKYLYLYGAGIQLTSKGKIRFLFTIPGEGSPVFKEHIAETRPIQITRKWLERMKNPKQARRHRILQVIRALMIRKMILEWEMIEIRHTCYDEDEHEHEEEEPSQK